MLKVEGKTRDIYVEDNGKSLHYRVKYMVMSMAQFWNAGISEFLNIRIFIQMLTWKFVAFKKKKNLIQFEVDDVIIECVMSIFFLKHLFPNK